MICGENSFEVCKYWFLRKKKLKCDFGVEMGCKIILFSGQG